jgi:hypothetical protein
VPAGQDGEDTLDDGQVGEEERFELGTLWHRGGGVWARESYWLQGEEQCARGNRLVQSL